MKTGSGSGEGEGEEPGLRRRWIQLQCCILALIPSISNLAASFLSLDICHQRRLIDGSGAYVQVSINVFYLTSCLPSVTPHPILLAAESAF